MKNPSENHRIAGVARTFRVLLSIVALVASLIAPCSAESGALATRLPSGTAGARRLCECRLDVWGTGAGLPGYDITALAQTPDGYIWVGTLAGLYRFDGTTFAKYDPSNTPGLTSAGIRSLCAARDGSLWVGTEAGGFGRLVGQHFERAAFPDSGWNSTSMLHQAKDGSIWAFYRHVGVPLLVRDMNNRITTTPLQGNSGQVSLVDMPDGSMLGAILYGDNMLRVGQDGTVTMLPPDRRFVSNSFTSAVRAGDGTIWFGADAEGLCKLSGNRVTRITNQDGLSSNAVSCLMLDRYGRLIVGTDSGLDCISPAGIEHISRSDGLGDFEAQALLQDREGNLWAGTGASLNRFAQTPLILVRMTTTKQAFYRKVVGAPDGNIYVATDDGVYRQSADPGKPPVCIWDQGVEGVVALSNGDLISWHHEPGQGFVDRIRRYHQGVWSVLGVVNFPTFDVLKESPLELIDYNGNVQSPGGPKSSIMSAYRGPMTFYVARNADGSAWMGTEAGLVHVVGNVATVANVGLPAGAHVLSIDNRDPKCIWLATDMGLVRAVNGRTRTYAARAGIPGDPMLQIACDNVGRVWVGTHLGLYYVNISDLDAYDAGRLSNVPVRYFTGSDGVRASLRVEMPTRSIDGKLWFLGDSGLVCVDPSDLRANTQPPPVVIESAAANDRPIALGVSPDVPPGRGKFTINFAALSYDAPEKVQFRYRLVGYEGAWTGPTTAHSATYTNLPPGSYQFEVMAENKDGVWSRLPVTCSFRLLPHFYETVAFRLLCAICAIGLLVGIVRFRTAQMRRHAHYLEQLVKERTAELAEAHERVQQQNEELQDMQGELEAQNEELQNVQAELEAQNEQLHDVRDELESQNRDLISTQGTLADANLRLKSLATTDGLTELINHRAFRDRLDEEYNQMDRSGGPLSLILLDVDSFKQFNDTYGHPAGDEVLRSVAAVLRDSVRASDIVARYGGEEFVIVSPQTDAAAVGELAERLRSAIADHEWKLRPITASFGAATIDLPLGSRYPSASELVEEADEALYESKRGGRNRVSQRVMDAIELDAAA